MRGTFRWWLGPAVLAQAAGCTGSTEVITPPPPVSTSFSLTVVADPEDASVAQALGWTNGIPNADVVLTPADSSSSARTAQTDSVGRVSFDQLPAGPYLVEVHRWLDPVERARLPAGEDANGWVAGGPVAVAAGGNATITGFASRRGSLVISEWSFWVPYSPGLGDYVFGGYLRLHNNADTTVYLDQMVIGEGFIGARNYPDFPCSLYDGFVLDRAGIWARLFQRFPGTGRDYPLAPGATIAIATDAIDHRPLYPGTLDLRMSDFEFAGTFDANNPAVPDLVEAGLLSYPDGHGLIFQHYLTFVAAPTDVGTLLHGRPEPASTSDWVRFPTASILDVFSAAPFPDPRYQECPTLVSPTFDRKPARAKGIDPNAEPPYSLNRRPVPGFPGVLQDTRTGDLDFQRLRRQFGIP